MLCPSLDRPFSSSTTGQYRVLTPTMYRSRMAAARQAVSMDYEGSRGPSMRAYSPFQRPARGMPITQDSLEMELGASATRVNKAAEEDGENY